MPGVSAIPGTVVARLSADASTARRLLDALAENLDDTQAVVSAFEEAGRWSVALHFREPPNETAVRALVALAAGAEAANELAFERIAAKDWVKASLAGLPAVPAGRFFVHGAHDRARVPANRIGIEIEAALAFGTGHHGTTLGCLLALDAILRNKRRRPLTRKPPLRLHLEAQRALHFRPGFKMRRARGDPSVLDVGTGSGVLAIAAARALPARVLASDIDPRAVRAARDNAHRNRAGARIQAIHAAGLCDRRFRARAPFDLVFANILLEPIRSFATPLGRLVAPCARVVLSGLLLAQGQSALARYTAQGFILERRIQIGGWVTLVLRRRARA